MRRELKWFLLNAAIVAGFSLFFTDIVKAQNGSLYFSPSSGNVSVGQSFSLALRVNTGGTAINAAEGSVVFDQQKLSVTSVSKSGSVFSIWAEEPKFSNAEGTIEFAGGVPNPGYSGSNGLVLTINFKAKSATTVRGYTEIVLVSGGVLANDGEGTNILASLGKANYYIGAAAAPVPVPEASVTPIGDHAAVITSSTHPDQSKWYSNNDPTFNWKLADETETVSYLVTDKAVSNPGTIPDGLVDEAKFTDIADGISYFHLRFREGGVWGPINHLKFQIDTKPPKEFNILVADDNSKEPKLTFESSDDLSGIARYEVKVGGKDWVVVDKALAGKPYSIINQGYGEHQVLVKAVDGAGNSITASTKIVVPGGIWNKFMDIIRWIFRGGLFPAVIVTLIALAHEFFAHSKMWKKINKNIKLKKGRKGDVLNLRDIKK